MYPVVYPVFFFEKKQEKRKNNKKLFLPLQRNLKVKFLIMFNNGKSNIFNGL
jgi:hypothetical protein